MSMRTTKQRDVAGNTCTGCAQLEFGCPCHYDLLWHHDLSNAHELHGFLLHQILQNSNIHWWDCRELQNSMKSFCHISGSKRQNQAWCCQLALKFQDTQVPRWCSQCNIQWRKKSDLGVACHACLPCNIKKASFTTTHLLKLHCEQQYEISPPSSNPHSLQQ